MYTLIQGRSHLMVLKFYSKFSQRTVPRDFKTSNMFSFQGMATVVAEEVVGQLPMARGTMTDGTEVVKAIVGTTSTTIPVGKNPLPVTAGMTAGVRAQAVTAEAAAVTIGKSNF